MLWENAKAEYIQVSFKPPLKFKEIFNVEAYEIHDKEIIIKKLELEGYVGLLFETHKISDLELVVPVKYVIHLSNGDVIKEVRKIELFRPQIETNVKTEQITINPDTGFVKGRIGIKNIGRGTLIIDMSSTKESSIKVETPPQHRKFAEKFLSDILGEFSDVAKEFPHFQTILDEKFEWENKDLMELSKEEREEFIEYSNRMATVIASDKDLLQAVVEAYARAYAKNTELIESVRKFIAVWESLVSKNILLLNPLDEVVLEEKRGRIALEISQTDRVFDAYDEVRLPKIELISSKPIKVPVYRLFEWG